MSKVLCLLLVVSLNCNSSSGAVGSASDIKIRGATTLTTTNSGQPGQSGTIIIRGTNSISDETHILWELNGVPIFSIDLTEEDDEPGNGSAR